MTETSRGDTLNGRVVARIQSLRGLFNVNQTQLAKVINISQSQMSKRLRGAKPFSLSEIEVFAEFFSTTPGYLLGYESGPMPRDPGRYRDSSSPAAGPDPADVAALRDVLDMMENFSSNDQRARYLLTSNWLRDNGARLAEVSPSRSAGPDRGAGEPSVATVTP